MLSENIILVGPMGAGKTTIGKKLANYLKRPFIDVDETIVKRLGVNIQTIFDTEGEAGFRERERAILAAILEENHRSIIATGGGCILTKACRQLIHSQRLVVHIDVGLKQQYQRVQYDKRRPILQEGDLVEKLKALREERHEIYRAVADLYILTDAQSFKQTIKIIEKEINP